MEMQGLTGRSSFRVSRLLIEILFFLPLHTFLTDLHEKPETEGSGHEDKAEIEVYLQGRQLEDLLLIFANVQYPYSSTSGRP